MNKSIKKVFSYVLILLALTLVIGGRVQVQATSEETQMGGATYYVEERKETNPLQYGVNQYTDISYSKAGYNTSGGSNCTSAAAGLGGGGSCQPNTFYEQQVHVLEVPSSTDVRVVPWSKMSQGNWNLATVKIMAANYEQLNPGYRVIAAVNGDFFDINSNKLFPKTPSGAHVSGGEYYKSTSGAAVSFTNNGTVESLIGNGTPTRTSKPILAIYDKDNNIIKEFTINKVNSAPAEGEISLHYANWALEAGWAAQKLVPISIKDATIVKGANYALPISTSDFYGIGEITTAKGDAELGTGDFAIVSKNAEVSEYLKAGVKIRAQYEYSGKFAGATDVVGVGETILYNNEYTGSDTNRHPRTMVGVKDDGTIVMTVVDGRQPNIGMYGATSAEMAAILKHYGCREGYNLDGGGSSTMVILDKGEFRVLNSPSDGVERSDSNCLLIVAKVPTIEYSANVETNKVTINANIVDQKGINFTDLYVELSGKKVKVENGKAVFTNLTPDTQYGYKFFGYLDGEYRDLVIEGKTATSKRMPDITNIYVEKAGDDLFVYLSINDKDKALIRQSVQIGDKNIIFTKGRAVFENFEGSPFKDFTIKLSYDLNDGEGRIDLDLKDEAVQCSITVILSAISFEAKDNIRLFLKP